MTRIRLQDGASSGYEIGTDAVKMFGLNSKVSYLYSSINKTSIAINTLPTTVTEVELNTKFAAAGNYSISIADIENIQRYSAVILTDKVTGKRTDLMAVGSYEYSVTAAGTSNRFKVQLAPKITTGISVSDDNNIVVKSKQNSASITGLSGEANVNIYDMSGKMVFTGQVVNEQNIPLRNKGLYLFDISTTEKSVQIKSFIR